MCASRKKSGCPENKGIGARANSILEKEGVGGDFSVGAMLL